METRLHSYETYLYKYVLPIAGIPWDGFRSLRRVFPSTDPNSATMIWAGMILWCVMLLLILWYALRLKTVVMYETGLRVGGYLAQIEVPFSDMAAVKSNWFMKNATLRLKVPSEFGDKILFIARRRLTTEIGNRSTLDLLRNLMNRP